MYESLPPVSKLWPFNVHATELIALDLDEVVGGANIYFS
jgi:hypothetical protein